MGTWFYFNVFKSLRLLLEGKRWRLRKTEIYNYNYQLQILKKCCLKLFSAKKPTKAEEDKLNLYTSTLTSRTSTWHNPP